MSTGTYTITDTITDTNMVTTGRHTITGTVMLTVEVGGHDQQHGEGMAWVRVWGSSESARVGGELVRYHRGLAGFWRQGFLFCLCFLCFDVVAWLFHEYFSHVLMTIGAKNWWNLSSAWLSVFFFFLVRYATVKSPVQSSIISRTGFFIWPHALFCPLLPCRVVYRRRQDAHKGVLAYRQRPRFAGRVRGPQRPGHEAAFSEQGKADCLPSASPARLSPLPPVV